MVDCTFIIPSVGQGTITILPSSTLSSLKRDFVKFGMQIHQIFICKPYEIEKKRELVGENQFLMSQHSICSQDVLYMMGVKLKDEIVSDLIKLTIMICTDEKRQMEFHLHLRFALVFNCEKQIRLRK
jgi:hypothetical protein